MSRLNLAIDAFPLSPMQQGMLFHHINEPHTGIDIEQLVVHLPEAVDAPRLHAAWKWLVERHDVLRARFVWEGREQARQEILPEVATPFVVENAHGLSELARREKLASFLQTDRLLGFDMSAAPMLRLTLFAWAEASFTLVWTFHHALLDGRTFPILLREAFEAYGELAAGGIRPRPAPHSYRRYIDWLSAENASTSAPFWSETLKGFSAPTRLVVDHAASDAATSENDPPLERQGEDWEILDASLTGRLRSIAAASEVTMNTVVMTAWSILLHRYSGEPDIVFGATRACRKSSVAGAADTIGIFINTVPVRAKVDGKLSPVALFKALRKQWMDMRPYEHTPLVRVKAASQVPPALPLFETLLVFENYRLDTVMRSLGGAWQTRHVELHELTNFPITLAAYDGDEISFKIEFDKRRLDAATVRRMLGHLHSLLNGIAANPALPIEDLPLLTAAERGELIEEFNRHDLPARTLLPRDGSATLHALFEAQVAKRPDAIAITCDGQALTYAQLNAQANRLARQLTAYGVKPDTLVGLCLDRSNELVAAILAILKAGGAYLPIDLAYPADRLAFMLEDARAPVLLTHSSLTANLPATNAKVICVDEILAAAVTADDERNLLVTSEPDHLAYVIYTSGTTGKPKGSQITHRNVARLFSATEHWYGFGESDVWTLFHSFAFDFSVWEIWGALLYGGRVVVVPFLLSRSPESFYELLAAEKVTVLNQTPSAFRQLIQAEETAGQKPLALRYVIFGGEALEMQSLRPWFERHGDCQPQLVNMYGITETTVHVTYRPLSMDDLNSGSVIGVPIPDLQIYILDARRQPVPIGVPGELYVGGAGLARGYLHRAELTAERFVPDNLTGVSEARLYKTGDLARFLPGRDIEYLGRIDDQVKIRGFRIELGEIESVLCQHPSVREASVLAREDVPGSKRLVAYLVTSTPAPEVSVLREHLKKKVPDYMVPAAFLFLDKLPLTASGKVDRKALPVPEQQRPELGGRYRAPRSVAEQKLAAIWSKILRVEKVGVHDNFFELGGDSILSIQVISAARRQGLKLTPKLLFANQTIAEIAVLPGLEAPVNEVRPVQEPIPGDVPLTPIQKWFFEQDLTEAQHYNQSFLFEVADGMNRGLLEAALNEVNRHHDALRLRFVSESDVKGRKIWRQIADAGSEPVPLTWNNLSQLDDGEQRLAVEGMAAATDASLDIVNGPLWRAAYFDLGLNRPGRLLLVVHHLAVDGVSWRPLIEDLETAYHQLAQGQPVALPPKTASFHAWAQRLQQFAGSESLLGELPYWQRVTDPAGLPAANALTQENIEAAARTLKISLNAELTQALLQQVPAAYNTQINDVLLTALARAWNRVSGSTMLFTNLEGHGRESLALDDTDSDHDSDHDDLDVSRTVGWFTSIFPVRLDLSAALGANGVWQPGEALKSVKEQLRQIPRRGVGYGMLRYLSADRSLAERSEPSLVFNYLGQFDQVVAEAKYLRFAAESSGHWHSPKQQRRHALEINSSVIERQLELAWTYSPALHAESEIRRFADDFLAALEELIAHCQRPEVGGYTPADFPLARLSQRALDGLVDIREDRRNIEDIYPLSPIQALFYSAHPGAELSEFDHWHCTLDGTLDVAAFQKAWHETVRRHPVLRSTVHGGEALNEPVQVVHREVKLPWLLADWSADANSAVDVNQRWAAYLAQDRAQPLQLTEAPAMRFALIRTASASWKFLWSVPALLLDGWSWPLVFRDASRLYEEFSSEASANLELGRPYREYLSWLKRQKPEEAQQFWKKELVGFEHPTPLPSETSSGEDHSQTGERYVRHTIELSAEATAALQAAARRQQVTLNALIQGAWALLLSKQSGTDDVVFGAAFSGRPTDLPGAESIVGPFVNNLPVRVKVNKDEPVSEFFKRLHGRLLAVSPFQFTPLAEIQRSSEVPWRFRLFDSLVVFQNYAVDESARRFGSQIQIGDFVSPIHSNYAVLLLAEPGESLRLTLIYDRKVLSQATIERCGQDLLSVLQRIPLFPEGGGQIKTGELLSLLTPPAPRVAKTMLRVQSQNYVPPQTPMEQNIASVWQALFGLERISIEENFFDLGGRSLLLIQMHRQLRDALKVEFPIVTLLEHPSIQALARYLEQQAGDAGAAQSGSGALTGSQLRDRAQRQKQALAQMRGLRK